MNFMRRNEKDFTLRCSPAQPLIRNSLTAQLPALLIRYRCMYLEISHSYYNPNLPGYFCCWNMLKLQLMLSNRLYYFFLILRGF